MLSLELTSRLTGAKLTITIDADFHAEGEIQIFTQSDFDKRQLQAWLERGAVGRYHNLCSADRAAPADLLIAFHNEKAQRDWSPQVKVLKAGKTKLPPLPEGAIP